MSRPRRIRPEGDEIETTTYISDPDTSHAEEEDLIPTPSDLGNTVKITNASLPYVRREVLRHFGDVKLLSNDGHHFHVNKSVMIANCKSLRIPILERDSYGEEVFVSTDLSKEDLGQVVNFFVTGLLPAEAVKVQAFLFFGVEIKKMKFGKTPLTEAMSSEVKLLIKKLIE